LNERFACFGSIGIKNVKELMQLLKKKDKLKELSMVDGLSEEYLTVLLREIKSTLPKPNKLADFNVISKDALEKLEKVVIKNTEKLFEKVITASERQNLADSVGISYSDILILPKLADLSRIKWLGVTYAQMLFQLGVDTVENVSKSEPKELHARLNQLIKEQQIFKGAIGLNDVNILIETAGELSLEHRILIYENPYNPTFNHFYASHF
jgi:uncharacterized membrane protein